MQLKFRIDRLSLSFGGVNALSDVSMDVRENEILAVIGPNGAGKTALLNCISGFYKPQKGEIFYDGREITRMRPDKVAKLGIARTFQNIELYTGLSTQDNIMASRHVLMKQNFITGALYFGWAQKEEIAASPDRRRDYRLSGNSAHSKEDRGASALWSSKKGRTCKGIGSGAQSSAS